MSLYSSFSDTNGEHCVLPFKGDIFYLSSKDIPEGLRVGDRFMRYGNSFLLLEVYYAKRPWYKFFQKKEPIGYKVKCE